MRKDIFKSRSHFGIVGNEVILRLIKTMSKQFISVYAYFVSEGIYGFPLVPLEETNSAANVDHRFRHKFGIGWCARIAERRVIR